MANLTQLGMLEGLDGFLLVDKPAGIAFSTVVKTVKRKFGLVKVGHGGSLDAFASGLFIVLLNDANKFVDQVMGADRAYEGTLRLGGTTDTGDANGRPIAWPEPLSISELKGDVFQTEPRYAAIRREGTAEYEIVDTGDHAPFLGHVYRFEVKSESSSASASLSASASWSSSASLSSSVSASAKEKSEEVTFSLRATKNVLPRALAQSMGATLVSVRRTHIGKFSVSDAIPFERLLEIEMKDFASCVMPLSKALL